jgi:hypothetical protein
MPNNYVLLDRIELNDTAASVTFDNIPQSGYTDLKLVISARLTAAVDFASLSIAFNGSTASFTSRLLQGDGSSAVSATLTNFAGGVNGTSTTANTFDNVEIYIPNYRSSNNKSFSIDSVVENNATAGRDTLVAGLWSNTAAITQVAFTSASGSFAANSTFSLYGLAQVGTTPAIAPKADGGNVIGTDGTYWYHAFLSNGTFTPQVGLTADVLTIAGGGAGGRGGGGAGGLVYSAAQSLTTASQTVTVGAGGAQRTTDGSGLSNPGNNSQFGSLTTAIGGGAAAGYSVNGGNGGSGGGAGWGNGQFSGGTATSGQGNNGGQGNTGVGGAAGGGGGAGAAGGNSTSTTVLGAGGVGTTAYSSWGLATGTGQNVTGTVYYAGGGSGSGDSARPEQAGGLGGGGASRSQSGTTPVAGLANTGGGGGGGSGTTTIAGGAGGSGIVIIRYLVA